jgi:uncharacterized protein YjiS (DUF1127 family)
MYPYNGFAALVSNVRSVIMKTITYAASSVRPSGKGDSFVRGVQGVLRSIDAGLLAAVDVSLMWHRRIADRHALRTMDDRLLKDIGLSQADVEHEAAKPFWRN